MPSIRILQKWMTDLKCQRGLVTHPPQEGPIRNLKGTSAGSLQKRNPMFKPGRQVCYIHIIYFEIKLEYVVPKQSKRGPP